MALETVSLMVGQNWELISAANPVAFSYRRTNHVHVMIYVGDAAPAAQLQLSQADEQGCFGPLGSAKVYARGIEGLASIQCVRQVSASNPAIL